MGTHEEWRELNKTEEEKAIDQILYDACQIMLDSINGQIDDQIKEIDEDDGPD